jgi:hypothetical protein
LEGEGEIWERGRGNFTAGRGWHSRRSWERDFSIGKAPIDEKKSPRRKGRALFKKAIYHSFFHYFREIGPFLKLVELWEERGYYHWKRVPSSGGAEKEEAKLI